MAMSVIDETETQETTVISPNFLETQEDLPQVTLNDEDPGYFAEKYRHIIGTGMEQNIRKFGISAFNSFFDGIDFRNPHHHQPSLIRKMQTYIQFGIDAGKYSIEELPENYRNILEYNPYNRYAEA